MKHKFLSLFIATVAMAILYSPTFASVTINGIAYELNGTTATVVRGGNYTGTIVIPASVTYSGTTYSVTSIGEDAFHGCSGLTSVTIPNCVTSIGEYAFFVCSSLTSVTIPNSVTSIGEGAFAECSGLTSVTIPNSVTSIEGYAFDGCSGLTSVTIPNSVTSIGERAFYYCRGLTSVTIGNSVTSIGNSAFYYCSSLTSVTIPNSVTSIGNYAFYECSRLTSVTIPNSVTSIGERAFYNCRGLTSVTIPNSVTSIGGEAFSGCSSLTSIYVPCGEMERFKQMLNNDSRINEHAPLPYTITISATNGNVIYPQTICDDMLLNATPDYGYHFVKWSDGNTDNPRTIELTQDITLTAEFVKNTYTISTTSANPEWGITTGGSALYLDNIVISATPNYGYHFVKWNDNNTSNPRTISVTENKTYTATFAKNVYTITKNATNGTISSNSSAEYLDEVMLTAIPNYGYHFTQWSDGVTDNPHTIVLTQDTTFTAEFAKNTYAISTSSANPEWGTTAGDKSALYLDKIEISATANYGYHFSRWNDGYTQNPRTVSVTGDKTYTATFAKNVYTITKNATNGTISGKSSAEYLDEVTMTANPNYGYHFAQWSDGNTDNPRTFVLTRDTTFTAQFAPNQYTLSLQCDGSQGIVEGAGVFDYLAQVQMSATPAYGYYFSSWSDGNTDNPRTYTITKDITLTANFALNKYALNVSCNAEQGSVSGSGSYNYLSNRTIEAIPNYGYHFAQWNDGNTDNPRTFVLTKDTTFTAQFAPNQYTLSLQCDGSQGTVEGAGLFDFLAQVQISATPAYGYYFVQWNDGNTANSRTVLVTEDKSYTATFAKNTYTITKIANSEQGSVSGPTQGEYLDNISLTATPEYGYYFTQWSDGNTDNPRTFELTRDTTFTALFAPNQCTVSLQCDENQGTVEGAGVFDYLAEVQISATPAYGYHFSSWSDGNTANPRTITVTKDVTITANFAPNKYSINVSCNAEQGSVKGSGSYTYLSNRTIEATSNYGYHFKQWSDGNTDNPRTIELRQDTTLVAIFAVDKYGTCGDNLQLTWRYDTGNQTLTISGEGDLTTNMRYGVEAVKEMKELVIEDGVGVIGNEAFANIKTLNTITLGKDVRKLQERVFYNCYNLTAIYNYRKTPASATSNTFEDVDKYACTIYVLAGSEDMFRSATGWKDFYSIHAIGASETTVTDNKVSVEPSDNSATVTWPVSNEAASYTIEITKDGVVFCRLTFNANGQLTGIAFAPGRDGQSMAPAAVMTANGLQFTVTGLTSNTQYGYSITATDAEDTEVASYTGTFTTTGEIATGIDAQQSDLAPRKFIRDNRVLIMRGGKTYTIQGVEVK